MKFIGIVFIFFFVVKISFSQHLMQEYFIAQKELRDKLLGQKYPPYNIITNNSKEINSANCKGKVVLFSFWFAGCSGCISEIDYFNKINKTFKNERNFTIVGITFEPKEKLETLQKKLSIKYPVASLERDSVEMMKYGGGYPRYLIIDKNNKIYKLGLGIKRKQTTNCESVDFIIEEIKTLLKN